MEQQLSQNSEELKKKKVLVCNCLHVIDWFRPQGRWCCQKVAKGTSSQTPNKILLHIRKSSFFFVSYTSTADWRWTDALAEILTETSSEWTSNDDQVVQLTLFSMYSVMYKGKKLPLTATFYDLGDWHCSLLYPHVLRMLHKQQVMLIEIYNVI